LVPALAEAGGNVANAFAQKSALQRLLAVEGIQQPGQPLPGQPSQNSSFSPINLAHTAKIAEQAGLDPRAYVQAKIAQQKEQSRGQLQAQKFEHERTTKAEPELLEREQKLNHYEQEGARFERLQELFSPELENKFPSSFSVGLLTKDGELRPTAAALLSPEAQESVKLIADNLSGAKDTFGARVTNFDLQAYMKRLPTLLNSTEGRRRVLRDLRLMNKLNTEHEKGVLEIIEKEGGPGKISLSQAERRYRKENAQEIKSIKEEFIRPEKKSFSDRPDPKIYQGRIIEDEETGEKFRSNGNEWVAER
jgi:hypothetical protein